MSETEKKAVAVRTIYQASTGRDSYNEGLGAFAFDYVHWLEDKVFRAAEKSVEAGATEAAGEPSAVQQLKQAIALVRSQSIERRRE
jgi:hypothetical protein